MPDIEHACPTCNGSGVQRHADNNAEWQAPCALCDGAKKVVPANQLRGAVEALRAIADNRVPHPEGYDVAVPTTVQAYAQGALTRTGGR